MSGDGAGDGAGDGNGDLGARSSDGDKVRRRKPEEEKKKAKNASAGAGAGAASEGAPFSTWMKFLGLLCVLGSVFFMFGEDPARSGPFAMPAEVRDHFARGRSIKVEVGTARRSIKVFVRAEGPADGEVVLLIHGMGTSSFLYRKVLPLLASSGLRTIAIDLPGSGLSEKFTMEEWKHEQSGIEKIISRIRSVAREIMEKGPFWRMEQAFQTGNIPEAAALDEKVDIVEWPVGAFAEESAEAISQVVDSLGAHRVHLVFHDTGSEAARVWALQHPARVRSVTAIDSSPTKPALPAMLVGSPGLGSFIIGSRFVYSRLLKSCCARQLPPDVVDAHAFLLRTGSGRAALLEMAKVANTSASLGLWSELKLGVPIQVLWSEGWSKEWKEEGMQIPDLLPGASLFFHSGSRWPQEDAPEQVAERIQKLVSSVPASERIVVEEEKVPEHIQKMFDNIGHDHEHDHEHHGHGGCSHGHDHGPWGL